MQKTLRVLPLLAAFGVTACSSNNPVLTPGPPPSSSPSSPSASTTSFLYTETNATGGNAVLAYSRAAGGALSSAGSFPTGGSGVGLPSSGLPFPIGGATGAVTLAPNGSTLYAADAGSADVAAFTVSASGSLALIGRYPTGGTSPASITVDPSGRYLYVLNTGSVPSNNNTPGGITGFTIGGDGSLSPLGGSTQPLSAAQYVDPSEVAFSPDGSYLVVTEKATNMIDLYPVVSGVAGAPVSRPAAGQIPFGFRFTSSGALVVANAVSPQNATGGTVSSYTANSGGILTTISNSVPDDQGAPCWVALTSDGTYAYVSNTVSGAISGYSVGAGGALTLLTPGGATAPQANTTGPTDLVVTPGNGYLYVLDSFAGASPGQIVGFAIGSGGALTAIPTTATGIPPGSLGLAAR